MKLSVRRMQGMLHCIGSGGSCTEDVFMRRSVFFKKNKEEKFLQMSNLSQCFIYSLHIFLFQILFKSFIWSSVHVYLFIHLFICVNVFFKGREGEREGYHKCYILLCCYFCASMLFYVVLLYYYIGYSIYNRSEMYTNH